MCIERENFALSTTTPGSKKVSAEDGAVVSTSGRRLQGWLLILLVFVAGACSLAVELSASRLLAPYFGTSLFVWANLIGLILLYLTIGYYLGGRLADRYPRPAVLYLLTIIASLLIGLIPLISRPILFWSLSAFATYSVSVFYGSLVSVILLFALPDNSTLFLPQGVFLVPFCRYCGLFQRLVPTVLLLLLRFLCCWSR